MRLRERNGSLGVSVVAIVFVSCFLLSSLLCGQCRDGCYKTQNWNDWNNDWNTDVVVCITYSSPAAGLKDFSPLVCGNVQPVWRAPSTRWRFCAKVGALGANNAGTPGNAVQQFLNVSCVPAGS